MDATSGSERRLAARLSMSVDLMLTIMMPEETFTPFKRRGVTRDLSLGGLCIKTYQLTKQDYLSLLKMIRYAKIELEPAPGKVINLRGQIVWMDYHDATKYDRAHCLLGICFQTAPQDYHDYLCDLTQQVSPAPPAGTPQGSGTQPIDLNGYGENDP